MRKYRVAGIAASAILKGILMLYALYLHPYRDPAFWSSVFGGVQAEGSKCILFVVLEVLPDFLFYCSVGSRYIRYFKENYVCIVVRERNRTWWVRKYTMASLLDILLYEITVAVFLFAVGMVLQERTAIQPDKFLIMFLCQFTKTAVLMIFCNMLCFRFHELAAVYGNLCLQALPLFLAGVLYGMEGPWEAAVKYIPLNWCNYNLVMEAGFNSGMTLCLSALLGIVLYCRQEKLFQSYDVV